MALYYKISDFNISGERIPEKIADKILEHHIIPMSSVQKIADFMIYPSAKSGYRSYVWEKARGRSGSSQHTFGEKKSGLVYDVDLGAVDWTCDEFYTNKDILLELIIENTNYLRLSIYDTFIHCDYKNTHKGKRLLFENNSHINQWEFIEFIN
jgi:hypothetical protein